MVNPMGERNYLKANDLMVMARKSYYNRVMSEKIVDLLKEGGKFHWLIDYVIGHKAPDGNKDLDFQTGSTPRICNNEIKDVTAKSWFSIYKGTGRVITIMEDGIPRQPCKKEETDENGNTKRKYHLAPCQKSGVEFAKEDMDSIMARWDNEIKDKGRYYMDGLGEKKEGYYQTLISRRHSLDCKVDDWLLIFDKEFKLGYANADIQDEVIKIIKLRANDLACKIFDFFDKKHGKWNGSKGTSPWKLPGDMKKKERINPTIAPDPKILKEMKASTECDFVGLNKNGDLVLLELKRPEDSVKIYLAPLQVATYNELVSEYLKNENDLEKVINEMVIQKRKLGMMNTTWDFPMKLSGKVELAVVVGSTDEKKPGDLTIKKFKNVRQVVENQIGKRITLYTCDGNGTLVKEPW